jgi:RNA polymerase sigma-54 factor
MDLRAGVCLGQRQQLIVTQRMQQALDVLQAPQADLAAILSEALVTNPFLEEEPPEDETAEVAMEAAKPGGRIDSDPLHPPRRSDWDESVAVAGRTGAWEDRDRIGQIPDRGDCWRAELVGQFRLEEDGPRDAGIAEYLLGCLDGRGYLAVPVTVIAAELRVRPERVERVRQRVLRLDPPGFAACGPAECLRVQLEERGEGDSLAMRLLGEDMRLLAGRRFDELAARLGASRAGVQAAVARIARLWPHPASQIREAAAPAIQPDLRVEHVDGQWMVSVVDRLLPRVRLAPPPERLARENAQTRLFIADSVARGRWLLGSLAARRRTLTRLMRFILEEQSAFFSRGVEALRPLGYRRMAELMELHESTIARAVRGKYVETPRGLFALRFFFDHGLSTRDGTPRSSAAIAHRIRALVHAEASGEPLPDEEIARRLHGEGVCIARRTVAKYRERMSIPKAAYRRRT